jgi:predicted ArsR family transcriptional regulator
MTSQDFDRTFGDLAATLGDPTRRGIYVTVREAGHPVTAGRIAEAFAIHPNVARHHLDRLVEDGYLRISDRKAPGAGGAGRPAKGFEATDKEILLSYPARRYDLLAELLVRVVQRVAPENGPAVAEQIGREYGRELAAEVGGAGEEEGVAEALAAVARAMMGVGFGVAPDDGEQMLLTNHCPFATTAANHPEVVCRLVQGIVRGLLEASGRGSHATVSPHEGPDAACITEM